MTLAITNKCVGCNACKLVCPNQAVVKDDGAKPAYSINANRCNECKGQFSAAQCASICPIEEAIVDEHNKPLNPLGSLTGIAIS